MYTAFLVFAQVEAICHCGKVSKAVRCSQADFSCGKLCGQSLACGHRCPHRCHPGPCPQCTLTGTAQHRPVSCPHTLSVHTLKHRWGASAAAAAAAVAAAVAAAANQLASAGHTCCVAFERG